jgi:Fe2+ transport system protein FeoA
MNTPATITSTDPTGGVSSKLESLAVTEDSSIHVGHSNLQNQDTTVFVDDANVVQRDESHVVHIDRTLMRMQDTNNDEQSIKSFLLRPIIIKQASFNITDTYSFLDSTSMPFTALNSANAVMWREKLRGIYGIRMDMRFRLVVNANRFQQGRYIMGWMPTAGMTRTVSALKEVALNNSHMATLVQRTTVPHVEVDLSTDTVAELLVPFVSCKSFYNLNAVLSALNDYPLGYLNIYPYSPLVSPAGSTTAGYTLYVSFENVQLFGASSPQSGLARHKRISDLEVSQK